jgi:co-chaperonin GroES (HSP10)
MTVTNPFDQNRGYQQTLKVGDLKPLRDGVIVTDMDFAGRKLSSGVILLDDDGKSEGIRPRWGRVYAVGPEQTDVTVGQWILLEHGRWSRGLKIEVNQEEFVIRRADPKAIIFVTDEKPDDADDMSVSTAVAGERKSREQFE